MVKIFISPIFTGNDPGSHGGIRRIIDAQREYFRSSLVESPDEADLVAIHAGSIVPVRPDQAMIAHCHGLYWSNYTWQGTAHQTINRAVLNVMQLSDHITAPTEWVANSIRHTMSRKVSVVGHAVDPEWKPGKENLGYVLWNKSRIDKVCDPSPVLKLAELMPDINFHMTVAPRGTPKNVTVTGLTHYVDKTPVQSAGVYLSTAQETFGIGILEALACGVPVVGWNWGGQAEIIDHMVTGYLATPGDYESLVKGIRWALENRNSDACVATASNYTWNSVCKKYEEIYETTLLHRRGRTGVSIVIRSYNTGAYLQEAIDSVVNQLDSEQDEVIVVDDCSTDNSKEVFDSVKHESNVKWVQTPKNLYLSGALNYGIEHTKGEYIVLLDADNMLTPRAIQVMRGALDKDRNIDIAYGRVQFVREDGRTPASELTNTPNGVGQWPPEKFNIDLQLSHKNQIPCTVMYRHRVWENVGPYRNRCKVAEDADFWCRATSLGYTPKLVTSIPTLIYRYRLNTTSQQVKDWPWEKWYSLEHGLETLDPCLISIILPVGKGHELLLQDACDSIYLQTYKNWECIIINDTGHELSYAPVWARVLDTTGEKGPAYARNIGLDNAKGKLAVFLDADDYLANDALAKMLKVYVQNQGHYIYPDYFRMRDKQHVKLPEYACQAIKTTMPHLITGLYPILDDVRFDESINLFEDWDFALNMTRAGHCGVRLSEPLVYYRRESGTRAVLDSPEARQPIIQKWGNIEMAGCSTCSKNKPKQASSMLSALGAPQTFDATKMTLLEYTGNADKQYFIGKSSGQTYSFGTLSNHRIKYVWNEDVDAFLARHSEFRLYTNQLVTA